MRVLLACVLTFSAGLALAQDGKGDTDAAKLVGRWIPPGTAKQGAEALTTEFTKDGKYFLGRDGKRPLKLEGKYVLEGKKLTVRMNGAPGVPGEVKDYVIKKLTDTQLILQVGKQTESYERAK